MPDKQEPVAWRYRGTGANGKPTPWLMSAVRFEDEAGLEIEPIYSASALASKDAEIAALREALEPFAAEADTWAEAVPDDHRSLCTEPGHDHPFEGSETTFTVGDLRRARAALAHTGKPTVKALEWRKPARVDTLSRADTIIGIYRVWTHVEANGRWFWGLFDHGQNFGFDHNNNECSSEDEAKAAAQADYEARILSALQTGGET